MTLRRVVVLTDSDREALAHQRVLVAALGELVREIVVAATPGSDVGLPAALEEEALRARDPGGAADAGLDAAPVAPDVGIADLDLGAPWRNPLDKAAEAWKLARILDSERPDAVHVVGLRPAALACLAFLLTRTERVVVHLPDLAALEPGGLPWPYRTLALKLLAALLRKPRAFLLVAAEDDLAELRRRGIDPGPRFAVLGGAGVDPEVYPVLPPAPGDMPVAAFVGIADAGSGVPELIQAFERLWARGLRLQIEVHGEPGADGAPDALAEAWSRWSLHPGVRCAGWPADAREIWRRAEICVWPAHARQGLPRVLLEAAACGRALLVTDTAGGRRLVRDGVEGLVMPGRDTAALEAALGTALERLARDAGLRQRMGAAARLRVLQGFTEAHVKEALRGAYMSLMAAAAH